MASIFVTHFGAGHFSQWQGSEPFPPHPNKTSKGASFAPVFVFYQFVYFGEIIVLVSTDQHPVPCEIFSVDLENNYTLVNHFLNLGNS